MDTNNLAKSVMINSLFEKNSLNVLLALCYLNGKTLNKKTTIDYIKRVKEGKFSSVYHPLSRFIFIIFDLKDLTYTKNNFEVLKFVNCGSQKYTGSICYLKYILSWLDKDFRHSMYNDNSLSFAQENYLN